MKIHSLFTLTAILISTLIVSCKNQTKQTETTANSEIEITLAKKPDSWINNRVSDAKEKLNISKAGALVWQSMEAHGGLGKWFKNGVLSFRFDYMPLNKGVNRKTIQYVDTWSNRVVHQDVSDTNDTFGWDGKVAWVKRNDTLKFPFNVRFWALTPYYFLGQPCIFDGKGVKLEKLEDKVLHGKNHDAVKISFEEGTGDAPDDYYINYYEKESHLLKAIRYIVSYPAYYKDGGHSPEKIMIVNDYKTIQGIVFPISYTTFKISKNQSEIGDKVTDIKVSKISFIKTLKDNYFKPPNDAIFINEL